MRIVLLVSGNLGKIVFEDLLKSHQVVFVLTDRNSFDIISICESRRIQFLSGNPRNGNALQHLKNVDCELLISVNYLFLIEEDLINLPSIMAINFHGSLLPKYRGRTPHIWAIINNEKETGITAHKIDLNCDAGDIIDQLNIQIMPEATGGEVLEIFNSTYPLFVNRVIESIKTDSYVLKKQDESIATYFGKRTPADGKINWDWQKERIYNWVRALAKPYPMAFTYILGQKVLINQIRFSDKGFNYEIPNGMIIYDEINPIVKTPNGCIELVEYQSEQDLQKGNILE